MAHYIPHPKNPKRDQTVVVDQDGSQWDCANGNIIAELFAHSPVYRRDTPDVVETKHHGKIGPAHNGERVIRVFVDAETALENVEKISGWRPEQFKASNETTLPDKYGQEANREMQRFMDRRYEPDTAAIAAAEKVFQQVDEELDMETLQPQIAASPVGGSPNIGGYLAGAPNSMWRQVSPMTKEGVVRIFVDLSSSAGYSRGGIRGRGVALLALARCIQRIRPVELWIGTTGTARQWRPLHGGVGKSHMAHTCFMMRLSVAPFDVNLASRLLADPFGGRGFCYRGELLSVGNPIGQSSGLAFSPIPFSDTVGATDQDICFGPMYSGQHGAIGKGKSAADWVKGELKAWLTKSGDSAAAATLV